VSEGEDDEREEADVSFNEDQQRVFANENRAANATRAPVGSQDDPILPGVPTSEEEQDREK
jgi:hypothetical protein